MANGLGHKRKHGAEWHRAARSLNLRTHTGAWLPVLSVVIEGVQVEVTCERAPLKDDREDRYEEAFQTVYDFSLGDEPPWNTLTMYRADRWIRGWWPFRLRYVTFDDPEFDDEFGVQCDDKDVLLLHFDARYRQRLRRFAEQNPNWTIKRGTLRTKVDGIADQRAIVSTVKKYVGIVNTIKAP